MKIYSGKEFISEEEIKSEQNAFDDFSCLVEEDHSLYALIMDLEESEEFPKSIFFWDEGIDYAAEIDSDIEMQNFVENIWN